MNTSHNHDPAPPGRSNPMHRFTVLSVPAVRRLVRGTGMRRRLAVLAVLLCMAGTGVAAAAPGAAAATGACAVKIGGSVFTSLQYAVQVANAPATLVVYGQCPGATTITKNLAITSVALGFGQLRGDDQGTVLTIGSGAAVTLDNLQIFSGDGTAVNGIVEGGGIINHGTLTVNQSQIIGNAATEGGGIYNDGKLTLNSATILGNTAGSDGAGIYNDGTLTLNGSSSITGNAAAIGGGIYDDGTVTLNGSSSITGKNTATDGAGIYDDGTLTLNDSSSITDNNASYDGGGVYVARSGNVGTSGAWLNQIITGNTAGSDGGGIWDGYGLITATGLANLDGLDGTGNVGGNTPDNVVPSYPY